MLPYFRKTESFYDRNADPRFHGFDGPINVTLPAVCEPQRRYSFRDPLLSAWREAGAEFNEDPGDGTLLGMSAALES